MWKWFFFRFWARLTKIIFILTMNCFRIIHEWSEWLIISLVTHQNFRKAIFFCRKTPQNSLWQWFLFLDEKMVLFSILIQDENDFDFDKAVFRHYKRMIGMVQNFICFFSVLLSFHQLPLVVSILIANGSRSKNPAIKTPLVELLFIFRH